MALFLKGKDLIELQDLGDDEIAELLSFAAELKKRAGDGEPLSLLEGVQLFLYDPDKVMPAWDPFRVAISQLGGSAHDIQPDRINLSWNETFLDLFAQLDRAGHGLAIASTRPGEGHGFVLDSAELMLNPVLNMISDQSAPFFALASLMAVEERLGGDSATMSSAVTWAPPGLAPKPVSLPLSLVELLIRRDHSVHLACPTEFLPGGELLERLDGIVPGALQITDDPVSAIVDVDLVFSLNWSNAESTAELERAIEEMQAHASWQLTEERFSLAAPGALLGGGMPQSRANEIEPALLEHARAIHIEEAANLLHIAKAVLALTLDLTRTQVEQNESIQ